MERDNTPLGLKHFHPMKMLLGSIFLIYDKENKRIKVIKYGYKRYQS